MIRQQPMNKTEKVITTKKKKRFTFKDSTLKTKNLVFPF